MYGRLKSVTYTEENSHLFSQVILESVMNKHIIYIEEKY